MSGLPGVIKSYTYITFNDVTYTLCKIVYENLYNKFCNIEDIVRGAMTK